MKSSVHTLKFTCWYSNEVSLDVGTFMARSWLPQINQQVTYSKEKGIEDNITV